MLLPAHPSCLPIHPMCYSFLECWRKRGRSGAATTRPPPHRQTPESQDGQKYIISPCFCMQSAGCHLFQLPACLPPFAIFAHLRSARYSAPPFHRRLDCKVPPSPATLCGKLFSVYSWMASKDSHLEGSQRDRRQKPHSGCVVARLCQDHYG